MKIIISPSTISGNIKAPPSKSYMQRACAAAILREGVTEIVNPGSSEDDVAAMALIKALGATVIFSENKVLIEYKRTDTIEKNIDFGESGLGMRMFTAILALQSTLFRLTGKGSLLQRPIRPFGHILPVLGVEFKSTHDKLPVLLQGPLQPCDLTIDGTISSQFLTGLLMAYSGANAKGVTISADKLRSKPYIDMTIDVLTKFGMKIPTVKDDHKFYFVNDNHEAPKKVRFEVEGDWSNSAFLLVAGATLGSVAVSGLNMESLQADRAIVDVLHACGAKVEIRDDRIIVSKQALKSFNYDATHSPDLFPPLVALAANCEGTSVIKGAGRLVFKESNRIESLATNFSRIGIKINTSDDVMEITGGTITGGVQLPCFGDHRIVMACAIAGLSATSPIQLEDAGAVRKSYPNFFEDIKALEAKIS